MIVNKNLLSCHWRKETTYLCDNYLCASSYQWIQHIVQHHFVHTFKHYYAHINKHYYVLPVKHYFVHTIKHYYVHTIKHYFVYIILNITMYILLSITMYILLSIIMYILLSITNVYTVILYNEYYWIAFLTWYHPIYLFVHVFFSCVFYWWFVTVCFNLTLHLLVLYLYPNVQLLVSINVWMSIFVFAVELSLLAKLYYM